MVQLFRKIESFKKDKELVTYTAFYLDLGNGVFIKVKPIYKSDYNTLKVFAKEYEK